MPDGNCARRECAPRRTLFYAVRLPAVWEAGAGRIPGQPGQARRQPGGHLPAANGHLDVGQRLPVIDGARQVEAEKIGQQLPLFQAVRGGADGRQPMGRQSPAPAHQLRPQRFHRLHMGKDLQQAAVQGGAGPAACLRSGNRRNRTCRDRRPGGAPVFQRRLKSGSQIQDFTDGGLQAAGVFCLRFPGRPEPF